MAMCQEHSRAGTIHDKGRDRMGFSLQPQNRIDEPNFRARGLDLKRGFVITNRLGSKRRNCLRIHPWARVYRWCD